MSILKNIENLSVLPGISGQEDIVRDAIIKLIDGKCEYEIDALGNLIAFKKGAKAPKNKLFFTAHMDEIGFIVTNISKEGMINFATVGGIDTRVIFGKSVKIGGKSIHGVIGGNPVHKHTDKELLKPAELDKMFIDIGVSSKEEALEHINLGDYIVYDAPFLEMGTETIIGKALDDRAGCALLIDLINQDLEYDTYFGFTVQEEVGCIGAETATFKVNPDIGIVVESTTASDIAGVPEDKQVCRQGKGPVISFMDRGTLYPQDLYNHVMAVAEKNNIPHQAKEGVFGGNDSRSIQTSRDGAKVVAVSMPTRYIHSPSNTLNKSDIKNTSKLLKVLVKELAEV